MPDPVFQRQTPLVFAHRGGAKEAADSTEAAFHNALTAHADVLEFDVSLTADGVPVVWHGPGLKHVHRRGGGAINGRIWDFRWSQLSGKAWIAEKGEGHPPEIPHRELLSLEEFARRMQALEAQLGIPPVGWNVEIKDSKPPASKGVKKSRPRWNKQSFQRVFRVLDAQAGQRKILLAGVGHANLQRTKKAVRKWSSKKHRYAFNLSLREQARYTKEMKLARRTFNDLVGRAVFSLVGLSLFKKNKRRASLQGHAFQTAHKFVTTELVNEVHRKGGAVHAVLTPVALVPGIDNPNAAQLRERLLPLLDTGVDGVITDYPTIVRDIVQDWRAQNGGA